MADDMASFEVARDILGELVAIAAAHLDTQAGQGGSTGTATWAERHADWTREMESLRPDDRDAVNAVLRSLGPLLASLRTDAS